MAHFAQIENGYVTQVIVVNNDVLTDADGNENETLGVKFCEMLFGGEWVQTSYNGNMRGKFAGIGDVYDSIADEFKAPELTDGTVD